MLKLSKKDQEGFNALIYSLNALCGLTVVFTAFGMCISGYLLCWSLLLTVAVELWSENPSRQEKSFLWPGCFFFLCMCF